MTHTHRRQRRHLALLFALALGMFGFAFALVPLYNVFCEITGLNGKTSERVDYPDQVAPGVDAVDREVTVEFLAQVARGMPWEFRPLLHKVRVRTGELHTATFYVRNRAEHEVTGQAVPSVAPGQAASYLHKTECFCFTQQRLDAGQETEMPVSFYVSADLPEEINTLSLSYTLYKVGTNARAGSLDVKL